MQVLLFQLGNDRYGIDTRHVVRVLPLLECKTVPHAPPWVAGLMNLRGEAVPVIDLRRLARSGQGGQDEHGERHDPGEPRFDTRIVLVRHVARDGRSRPLGLIVEHAREVIRLDPSGFAASAIDTPQAPYLGEVTTANGAILQLVDVDRLLGDEAAALLYPESAA
ncbi:chemotaxis protein CheW [Noviherbaspirillum galbum]|uniref:Purine-binding chemotaxis protein CheW n=1 Tax=Noviherbaspirillum galbum TaxID=2709383 RepID=A0A6B3SQ64_9BURK|nr:chemotaxis protein CheW [Noviherbaspirillum galbum]NEX60552.1 purine-binding chemotaxis protein CheW [Noviherbaspirillum galbum]